MLVAGAHRPSQCWVGALAELIPARKAASSALETVRRVEGEDVGVAATRMMQMTMAFQFFQPGGAEWMAKAEALGLGSAGSPTGGGCD